MQIQAVAASDLSGVCWAGYRGVTPPRWNVSCCTSYGPDGGTELEDTLTVGLSSDPSAPASPPLLPPCVTPRLPVCMTLPASPCCLRPLPPSSTPGSSCVRLGSCCTSSSTLRQ